MNSYRVQCEPVEKLAVQALNHISYGIVIVSEAMKVILYNEAAAMLFSTSDGIGLARRYLTLHQWGTDAFKYRISETLYRVAEKDLPYTATLRVERPSGKVAYQVIARPLCNQSDDDPPRHQGVWILSIHDPDQRAELPCDLLRDYYQMTEAEIDVCRQLFITGSIDDAAKELGISRNTVKTHLRRIYVKSGVKSQSMLVMRLTLGLTR